MLPLGHSTEKLNDNFDSYADNSAVPFDPSYRDAVENIEIEILQL